MPPFSQVKVGQLEVHSNFVELDLWLGQEKH
jgi:hypothetical protein